MIGQVFPGHARRGLDDPLLEFAPDGHGIHSRADAVDLARKESPPRRRDHGPVPGKPFSARPRWSGRVVVVDHRLPRLAAPDPVVPEVPPRRIDASDLVESGRRLKVLASELSIEVSLRAVERAGAPYRRRLAAKATLRFETPPGRQLLQIDFCTSHVRIGGEEMRVHLFVATLGVLAVHLRTGVCARVPVGLVRGL